MKVYAYYCNTVDIDDTVALLSEAGMEVFSTSEGLVFGRSVLKMFINEEQETFLKLKFDNRNFRDCSA